MEGPVDLDFLANRIARAPGVPGNDIKPEIDRISLEWGGISQPMRLAFNGLRFINSEHQVIATVPHGVSCTFDARNVLQGMFPPTSITIEAPTIEADIAREGGMLRRVFTDPTPTPRARRLSPADRAAHGRAQLQFADRPARHDPDRAGQGHDPRRQDRAHLDRAVRRAPASSAMPRASTSRPSAKLTGDAGNWVDVSLSGVYTRDRSRISLDATIDGFKPSMLADLSPDIAVAARRRHRALSGRLHIEADGQRRRAQHRRRHHRRQRRGDAARRPAGLASWSSR